MNPKPILFNDRMVRAILEGRKTQTRRLIKPQPTNPRWSNIGFLGFDDGHGREMKPRYKPGDILYVREAWSSWSPTEGTVPRLYYRADGNAPLGIKWRPSIHMPRAAARIFIRVKDLCVQKLREMTFGDVIQEGFSSFADFFDLWDTTIPKNEIEQYGYSANPWIWVYQFERISKAEAESEVMI